MEEICKNCKHCMSLGNTDECGEAVCNYPFSFITININDKCRFIDNKELTCGDCDRFANDTACLTSNESDSAYYNGKLCGGFISADDVVIKDILFKWKNRKENVKERLLNLIEEFESEYEYPFDSIDDE